MLHNSLCSPAMTFVCLQVRLILSLRHSNVLQFREWYETSQHVWVVTELASGGSLALLLEQDGRVALGNVPDFLSDIAAGLNYLHTKSIIYCDLQPQKVHVPLSPTSLSLSLSLSVVEHLYLFRSVLTAAKLSSYQTLLWLTKSERNHPSLLTPSQ